MVTTQAAAKKLQVAMVAAKELCDATKNYSEKVSALREALPLLEDYKFWRLLEEYRPHILQWLSSTRQQRLFKPSYPAKAFVQSLDNKIMGLRFARTYREKSTELYDPLFDIVEGRGDDGYGDLLDSLVLAGQEIHKKCIAGDFKTEAEIKQAIQEEPWMKEKPNSAPIINFIFEGENYNSMYLMEKSEKAFVYQARKFLEKQEEKLTNTLTFQ